MPSPSYSAYLGASFPIHCIGVNHVAWEGGSDEYVSVWRKKISTRQAHTRNVDGIPAVLLKMLQLTQLLRLFRISQVP